MSDDGIVYAGSRIPAARSESWLQFSLDYAAFEFRLSKAIPISLSFSKALQSLRGWEREPKPHNSATAWRLLTLDHDLPSPILEHDTFPQGAAALMNNQHPSSAPPPPTKTPGSSILSLAALAEFTKHHPASPRATVQEYLRDQRTRSFAPVVFARAPSPALPRGSHIPSPHQRRRPSPPEGAAELALVMHRETAEEGKENGRGSGKRAREEGEERRGVKKVSLVAAMRPRLSSQPAVSPVGSLEEEKEKKGDVGGEGMKENGDTSSPLLVARADMDGDEEEAGPQDDGQEEVVKPKKRERRVVAEEKKPRAEEERSPAAPAKAGGSRRKKPDKSDTLESEEDREVMERESSSPPL